MPIVGYPFIVGRKGETGSGADNNLFERFNADNNDNGNNRDQCGFEIGIHCFAPPLGLVDV